MNKDNQNRDSLSMGRFRDINIEDLTPEEHIDYVLAKLMQATIQKLEGSIQSDRIFQRTKYDVMAAFWASREELQNRKED